MTVGFLPEFASVDQNLRLGKHQNDLLHWLQQGLVVRQQLHAELVVWEVLGWHQRLRKMRH